MMAIYLKIYGGNEQGSSNFQPFGSFTGGVSVPTVCLVKSGPGRVILNNGDTYGGVSVAVGDLTGDGVVLFSCISLRGPASGFETIDARDADAVIKAGLLFGSAKRAIIADGVEFSVSNTNKTMAVNNLRQLSVPSKVLPAMELVVSGGGGNSRLLKIDLKNAAIAGFGEASRTNGADDGARRGKVSMQDFHFTMKMCKV